jgi:type I restriction enzyme, R subunit
VAGNLHNEPESFEFVPFSSRGGLGRAYALFGDKLNPLLDELNIVLTA